MKNKMIQIVEQTYEEKMKMYRKVKKDELIEMLINCNLIIENTPLRMVCTSCDKEIFELHKFCKCN